jgi:hypothetical protein
LKRKACRIEDDLLSEDNRNEYPCLPHSWPHELERGFFQTQEEVPGWSVEEKFEGFLVKLKLLTEEKLVESLVGLKFLAEEKMDPSLVKLEFLLEKEMVESLVKLELLLEERMAGSLVKLDLRHVEENSPQFGSPMFPMQIASRRVNANEEMVFKRKDMVKVLPIDGALVDSVVIDGC